jgi:hypothetical protein
MLRYEVIKSAPPFDKWATDRFVKAAIAKLGTAR